MDKAPSYKSWDLLALFRELFKAHFSCNAVELNPATLSGIYRKDYALSLLLTLFFRMDYSAAASIVAVCRMYFNYSPTFP